MNFTPVYISTTINQVKKSNIFQPPESSLMPLPIQILECNHYCEFCHLRFTLSVLKHHVNGLKWYVFFLIRSRTFEIP